ncbi:MAG TPA: hypothetical protein VJR05_12205 [Acidimicrobiia bacterium]|nr:hypothetical protein [Acidimicrobiia bacterium]
MEPISIPPEVAKAAGVPADLDSAQTGPYRFPDPRRRRLAGFVHLGLAVSLVVVTAVESLPASGYLLALAAVLLAGWHFLAAWPLAIGPEQALTAAAALAPFPIGHSSAAVTFHGWRARPRWHVILYDAFSPPVQRALVVIDAVDGRAVGETYVENITPQE